MRNLSAAFYDPYLGESLRWPRRITPAIAAIGVTSLVLVGFVAADLNALEAVPVKVSIQQVNWLIGNVSVGNESGFTILGGHTFPENLVCEIFCPPFGHASVSAPFTIVTATVAYPWYEYVNLTIRAPASPYSGPLNITLTVAPLT